MSNFIDEYEFDMLPHFKRDIDCAPCCMYALVLQLVEVVPVGGALSYACIMSIFLSVSELIGAPRSRTLESG